MSDWGLDMFSSLSPIINWLFDNVSTLARFVWSSGWVGVCVIAIPLARKVVNIFKQIF